VPFDLTTGQAFVIALRILVPLLIPRFPFWGGVAAALLDGVDVIIVEFFGPGGMGSHYHQLDKVLDLYYLAFEAAVALTRWTERLPRLVAGVLFVYRLIGVALFELIGERWLLFVFPNLFENWFLFVAGRDLFKPTYALDSWRRVLTWLVILYIPKIGQEWLLHVQEAQPWGWFKDNVLHEIGIEM
jgi:hypothetical protein